MHVHTEDAYQTFERASIAAESPENPRRSGDGQVMNDGDENATHRAETMQKRPQMFAGTCYRCGEAGHRARNCRMSKDAPKCSAKGRTTADGRKLTRRREKRDNSTMKVDGTALLGGEPAKRAPEVDETMRSDPQRLVRAQTNFEESQRSENAKIDVPSAHGLPLEGEWIVCASGEASCEMGMSESGSIDDEAEVVAQMPAKSSQQLAGVDGDAGRKVEPTDTTNVPEALVTASNDLENLDCGDIPRMYLRSTNWYAGDPNGLGSQMDGSSCKADVLTGQVDVLRGWTETLRVSDSPETASISHGDNLGSYLGAGGTKHSAEVMEGFGSYAYTIGNETETTENKAEIVSMRLIESKPPNPLTMSANACANESNGCGNPAETSTGHGESPGVETDAETSANAIEIVRASPNEPKPPNLPIRSARSAPDKPNGCGNRPDASSGCTDMHSAGNDAQMAVDEAKTVRTPPNEPKMRNLPAGAERRHAGMADGFRSHMDTLTTRKDTHTTVNNAGTAENVSRNVRSRQYGPKTKNSPNADGFAMPKRADRRRWVSADGINVNLPLNEVLDTASQKVVFERLESREEAIAPDVEGKTAEGDGDGDGDRNGDDGDGDDTESGGSANSQRVESAQLSTESQHMYQSGRIQDGDSPVSSRPPIRPAGHPYGDVRHRRGRGRIKSAPIKVSHAQKVETTHLGCVCATLPRGNPLKGCLEVHRWRRQRGRVKIKSVNVKIERLNDKMAQNGETTYLGCMRITQPPESPANASKRLCGVHRTRRQRGRIKIGPINVSSTRNGGSTYLQRVITIPSTWRPKKDVRRSDKLTVESRMLGEPWRDVEDHG